MRRRAPVSNSSARARGPQAAQGSFQMASSKWACSSMPPQPANESLTEVGISWEMTLESVDDANEHFAVELDLKYTWLVRVFLFVMRSPACSDGSERRPAVALLSSRCAQSNLACTSSAIAGKRLWPAVGGRRQAAGRQAGRARGQLLGSEDPGCQRGQRGRGDERARDGRPLPWTRAQLAGG